MSNYLVLFISVLLLCSCSALDDKEQIPSYIYIDSVAFEARPNEGTDVQSIPYSWVSLEGASFGDFVGAYEHPRLIPLNYEGDVDCIVQPGIVNNGISALYDINEIMTPYRVPVNLVRGEIDTIYPVYQYDEDAGFGLINDFDDDRHDFNEDLDGDSFTRIAVTSSGAYSGKSARIRLYEGHEFIYMTTKTDIENINVGSGQKILEVHYKNDVPVEFGLRYYEDNGDSVDVPDLFGLNPSEEWNKVYINYTTVINGLDADRVRILIRAILPVDMEEGFVYFDNIKFTYENQN